MDMKKFAEELKRKSGDNGKKAWSLVELWYTRDGRARRLSLHDLHELSQAIAEELARIRAEARAEAASKAKSAILDFGKPQATTDRYSPMIRKDLAAQLAERAILAEVNRRIEEAGQ